MLTGIDDTIKEDKIRAGPNPTIQRNLNITSRAQIN
jgi:hypothetical protein